MNSLGMMTRESRPGVRHLVRQLKAEAQSGAKSKDKGLVKPDPKRKLPKKPQVNRGTKSKLPKSSS